MIAHNSSWGQCGLGLLATAIVGCFAPLTILVVALRRLPAQLLRLFIKVAATVMYRVRVFDQHHVPAAGGAAIGRQPCLLG